MKGDECRPAADEALLLAFLRAALAASADAIDISNGGGQVDEDEQAAADVGGDGILGEDGPKLADAISSLPNQGA